jgi:nitroreductase
VWDKNVDAAAWQKAFDCLVPGNQAWVKDAPLLFLIAADSLFVHNGKENRWGQYDTGAAAENLCLQATSMGLMAHQMGGFDSNKAREAFAVPEQYALMAMLSVGYPADVSTLSGEMLERETAPRKRRELGELFYTGIWGKPVV